MIKKFSLYILAFSLFSSPLFAAEGLLSNAGSGKEHILVNNRILAKVNGKPISVIDVMKRMDVHFYKQYPQYIHMPEVRLQFYDMSWKQVLSELIDKELVLTDAKENKLPISNGDIRQEMEELFGPNIIANLDKAGLNYEEAWEMIKGDILIRRMFYVRVNSKAQRKITPQAIRDAYEVFSKENIRPEKWTYRVISFRGKDPTLAAEAANEAHRLLTQEKVPVESLEDRLKPLLTESSGVRYNLSDEMTHAQKEISASYFDIVGPMKASQVSHPIVQQSRAEKAKVFRIFYVKNRDPGGIIPFHEVEAQLKEKLVEKEMEQEMDKYLAKLRKNYHVDNEEISKKIPDNFKPFTLY